MMRIGRRHSDDRGFTLIELLVVMVILGILAAIAIPLFLSQRRNAWDTSAKSDLRTSAAQEEGYYASALTYGTFAVIDPTSTQIQLSPSVTVTIVWLAPQAFCLSAKSSHSANTYYYDSQAGGLQPQGTPTCPVTNAGVAGDSRTG